MILWFSRTRSHVEIQSKIRNVFIQRDAHIFPGCWFSIKMPSCMYQWGNPVEGKTVVRSSYLHNGENFHMCSPLWGNPPVTVEQHWKLLKSCHSECHALPCLQWLARKPNKPFCALKYCHSRQVFFHQLISQIIDIRPLSLQEGALYGFYAKRE